MTLEPLVLASLYAAIGVVGGVLAWAVLKTHEHAVTLATLQTTMQTHGGKHTQHETTLDNLRTTLEQTNALLADFATQLGLLFDGRLILPSKPGPRAARSAPAKTARKK